MCYGMTLIQVSQRFSMGMISWFISVQANMGIKDKLCEQVLATCSTEFPRSFSQREIALLRVSDS
jgi:hypothetical protein